MRRAYLTDLSDAEWECIKGLLPAPEIERRPRLHSLREILNAIFYVARGGCAWRLLPHDFPPWKTVYHYFRIWRIDGTWECLHEALRRRVRVRLGQEGQRAQAPSSGGHRGVSDESEGGPRGERLRARRDQGSATQEAGRGAVPASLAPVAGRWIQRQ